ncbi:MAG TPA: amino acid adenylation domain-containing protein [Ruminiclostridium sp.]|nr:amino acid adenylation domain-containing protein [Ruminiclostridium sp.]
MTNDNIKYIYSLTPMQEGMLYHNIVGEQTASYVLQTRLRMTGKLDVEKVKESLSLLADKYEILRTMFFYKKASKPWQVVLRERGIECRTIDLSEVKEQEKEIANLQQADIERGFDLEKDSLLRVTVLRKSEKEHVLLWSMHHIIIDGWSLSLLSGDFLQYYEALAEGKTLSFMQERVREEQKCIVPYGEYVKWIEKQDKEEGLTYWGNLLNDYNEAAEIPPLGNCEREREQVGDEVYTINSQLSIKLQEICTALNVTMSTMVETVWGILLQKYSRSTDVVFGKVVSGRNADIPGIEKTVGLFINTIPARVKCEEGTTARELLEQMQQQSIESMKYDYCPLSEIQRKSALGSNLIKTLFAYENYYVDESVSGGISGIKTEVESLREQTSYGISLGALVGDSLILRISYNSGKYSSEEIKTLLSRMELLLRQIADQPEIRISGLSLAEETERKLLMEALNGTDIGYTSGKTVAELFEDQVKRNPDGVAVAFERTELTYRELNAKANALAWVLRSKGIKADSIVGIIMDNSIDMIVSMLAVLKAGGAYLPIDVSMPQGRIISMLDDCRVSIVLTRSSEADTYSFTALQNIQHSGAKPYTTKPRPQIRNLDSLPFPDRSLVNYDIYNKRIGLTMVKNIISIQGTRGCPYNCAYCHKIWPKSHYKRSAQNIFDEVMLYYRLGVRRFAFIDDIFNLDAENSGRFFELVIKHGLDIQIHFPAGLRGDILTKEYIDLMVKAGTVNVALALETASPRLQKLIGKNLNIEKLSENIKYFCEKYPQVILGLFLMIGFPTESEEEVKLTLDFIKNHKWIHFPYLHLLKIYPNTDMEQLAMSNGISKEAIYNSADLPYHELPETLPFSKSFTLQCQTEFLNGYFLSKERLLHVLPYQLKVLTIDEIVQKYDSYLPAPIKSFDDLLRLTEISREELNTEFLDDGSFSVPDLNDKIKTCFPEKSCSEDALRVLLLDTSQYFSDVTDSLHPLVEPPLGLMYLLTGLNEKFGDRISGKIAKASVDFDSYESLKSLIEEFKPDVIGIRTLTYYKDFFHKTVALIRQWGFDKPIISGGPYGSSDYNTILQDKNVDVVILGEGEETICDLIEKIILNKGKLPGENVLKEIPGISFLPGKEKLENKDVREIIMVDDLKCELDEEFCRNPDKLSKPGDLAYIIYTSGTTGKPKGVMIEHRNITQLMHSSKKLFDFSDKDIWTMFHSYCFDFSVWEMYGALLYGGKLIVMPKSVIIDTKEFMKVLINEGVTVLNQTPSIFYRLMEEEQKYEDSKLKLRYVIFGGEALKPAKLKDFYRRHREVRLINMYGITETTVHATYKEITEEEIGSNISNIGKPLPTLWAYVADTNMQLLPAGIAGELCIGGGGLARGYLNRLELTQDKFVSNPYKESEKIYKSGDLVRLLPNNELEYMGRIDSQVKIRGFRIELGEIESKLLSYEYVKAALVISREDEDGERYICAYIVADKDKSGERELTVTELRQHLSKSLPEYMIPAYFVQLDHFPTTVNGKLDRKVLPEPNGKIVTGVEYEACRNETEERLVKIWQEVLRIDRIGINDNFFDIGGTSIKALAITSKLNHSINVADLLKHNTIASLAQVIIKNERKMLYNLSKSQNEKYPIICVPYAGGNSFIYKNLSEELSGISGEYSVYSIEMPRDDESRARYDSIMGIAQKSVEEICSSINKKGVYLYGHCMGSLLTIEIGKMLEKRGCEVKGIFLGAVLPSQNSIIRGEYMKDPFENTKDEEVLEFLNSIGGLRGLDSKEEMEYSIKAFKEDVIIANHHEFTYHTTSNKKDKLNSPVFCIIGDADPITANYPLRYKEWENISDDVSLSLIKGGDHYFITGYAKQVAQIINEKVKLAETVMTGPG